MGLDNYYYFLIELNLVHFFCKIDERIDQIILVFEKLVTVFAIINIDEENNSFSLY